MHTLGKPVVGPPITADDLKLEIAQFEAAYQMNTARFLERYADPADAMEDVEDAAMWHLAYVALSKADGDRDSMHQPPPWAEDLSEERGPERALVLF